jgi:Ca-activated chloride channel family protein
MANWEKRFEWLDLNWFRLETLLGFQYENSILLYFIGLIPVVFLLRFLLFVNFRQKIEVALFRKSFKGHWTVYLRFLPDLVLSAILALMLVALARPQKTSEILERNSEGIDIVLLMDISESMKMKDLLPDRLDAAKEVAKDFVNGRGQDRIGLVVFSGEAFSMCPVTSDYELLNRFIDEADFSMIQKPGTAIGLAIGVATNRLMDSKAKSKVMILLSDGDNTAGNIDPFTAARVASSYKCRIYTIGLGKDGRVFIGSDPFGNEQYVDNTMDESTLREIARIGGGQYYRAADNNGLKGIFSTIDKLEKSEYKEKRYKNTSDYYQVYLQWAILLFLVWLALKSTFVSNPIED